MYASVLLVGWGWTVDEYLAAVTEIDELGYHACYIGDDLFAHQADADVGTFEPWTMLPAMAGASRQMRLGSLVSPAGRRHPGLFAKITATADLLSHGRLIVGMGAGNAPEQQRSLGLDYPPPGARVAMLAEELEILRSMWTDRRTDFEGDHYRMAGGICEPKPARAEGPEIMLGVHGNALIEVAGRFADRVNVLGGDDERIREVVRLVRAAAAESDRDGDAIVFSRLATVILTDEPVGTADQRHAAIDRRAVQIGMDPTVLRREVDEWIHSYVGPLDGVADWVRASTVDVGLEEIVICIDTIDTVDFDHTMTGLRALAATVINDQERA